MKLKQKYYAKGHTTRIARIQVQIVFIYNPYVLTLGYSLYFL